MGLGIKNEPLALLWDGLSTGWSAGDTYQPDPPSRVDQLHATDDQQTLGRQHSIAQSLMAAGFPAKISPAAFQAAHPSDIPIADQNGDLRSFADILRSGDAGLDGLDSWFIATGMAQVTHEASGRQPAGWRRISKGGRRVHALAYCNSISDQDTARHRV